MKNYVSCHRLTHKTTHNSRNSSTRPPAHERFFLFFSEIPVISGWAGMFATLTHRRIHRRSPRLNIVAAVRNDGCICRISVSASVHLHVVIGIKTNRRKKMHPIAFSRSEHKRTNDELQPTTRNEKNRDLSRHHEEDPEIERLELSGV